MNKKDRGECDVCGHFAAINKDGTMRMHKGMRRFGERQRTTCAGSRKPPRDRSTSTK